MQASAALRHLRRCPLLVLWGLRISVALALCVPFARAQTNVTSEPQGTNAVSRFRPPDDGWFDVSGFLEEKYGFIPVPLIITEPAVGYGGGAGLMFLSKPLPRAEDGLGRPNITVVGGFGTENGTWGTLAGDMRYWLDEHLQTLVGLVYSSVNLDFYGIGNDPTLANNPLRYNLEPKGGTARAKYRSGDTRLWAGLNYAFASTEVTFDKPPGTPGEPPFQHESHVGGFTPSLTSIRATISLLRTAARTWRRRPDFSARRLVRIRTFSVLVWLRCSFFHLARRFFLACERTPRQASAMNRSTCARTSACVERPHCATRERKSRKSRRS